MELEKLIREALIEASRHDEKARDYRRQAGRLLAELRAKHRNRGSGWWRQVGITQRSAELLVEMAGK